MTLPMFPTTVIGSWPRSKEVQSAMRDKRAGRITDEEFQKVADQAILQILKWQEETLTRHVSPDFIWQTDWITTAMTWEEEGHITGGTNTFLGCYTRTFKSKVLHDRLPTATRKRLYDPNYPTIKCLYCTAPETTAHVLTCARTKVDLTTILINMHSQLDHNLDPEPVSNTFFQPDPRHQAYLIRDLVPATWTSKSKALKETRQAAAKLINNIINLFRKLIWNPWCQERKQ